MSNRHSKEEKATDLPSLMERYLTAPNFLYLNWVLKFISSLTAKVFLCKHEIEYEDLLLAKDLAPLTDFDYIV